MTDHKTENVHNHGPAEGRGLDCPERVVEGQLRGACLTPRSTEKDAGRVYLVNAFPNLRTGEDPRPVRCAGKWCGGEHACPACPIPPGGEG